MSKLRKLDVDANPDDYGVLLEAMCKWGKVDEVLEQVSDWLRSEVTGNGESQPTSSKKVRKLFVFIIIIIALIVVKICIKMK